MDSGNTLCRSGMNEPQTKLLFITQKIHQHDDDLAFVILWVKEFMRQGVAVQVICLEKGDFDESFPVYSLGKEKGKGKLARMLTFLRLMRTLDYNRVFVHMNPEYVTLGGWYCFLRRVPVYLWYTHYTMHVHLWLSGIFCKRIFAATAQSLPQYEGNKKKVVTGHGIDIDFWLSHPVETDRLPATSLVAIHRLCRSQRLELGDRAPLDFPQCHTITLYGRDVEKEYVRELHELVEALTLKDRVFFLGPVPMAALKRVYPRYRVMVNMASETIDKTMLEGMLYGVYPVTTPANSRAIGLPLAPKDETPESVADFIVGEQWKQFDEHSLKRIVENKHSLSSLIA